MVGVILMHCLASFLSERRAALSPLEVLLEVSFVTFDWKIETKQWWSWPVLSLRVNREGFLFPYSSSRKVNPVALNLGKQAFCIKIRFLNWHYFSIKVAVGKEQWTQGTWWYCCCQRANSKQLPVKQVFVRADAECCSEGQALQTSTLVILKYLFKNDPLFSVSIEILRDD